MTDYGGLEIEISSLGDREVGGFFNRVRKIRRIGFGYGDEWDLG